MATPSSSNTPAKSPPFEQNFSEAKKSPISVPPNSFYHSIYKGEPAIIIPRAIEAKLAAQFEKTLIGKFSQGRPSMEAIRKFLAVQNFKGMVAEGLLDQKHVLFRFNLNEDYVRIFSRPTWIVDGKPMRILKWIPEFQVDKEPSIVPLWISLPNLPIHLINEDFIFSLVSAFSKPLRIDTATENLKRPSVARVQVEADLLKMLPSRVWIQNEDQKGFWQTIAIEGIIPYYCDFCCHLGHQEHSCVVKHPELWTAQGTKKKQNRHVWEYREKVNIEDKNLTAASTFTSAKKQDINANILDVSKDLMQENNAAEALILPTTHISPSNKQNMALQDLEENVVVAEVEIVGEQGVEQGRAKQRQEMDSAKSPTKEIANSGPSKAAALCTQKQKGKENAYEGGMVTKINLASTSNAKIIGTSEALTTRNSFDMLSELDAARSPQLSMDSIQAELQFMNLDSPNIRRTGYTSDKDSKVKLTPAQRIRRTRKKKKIFDL